MSKIKSITKKKIENETLWNLAVEDDESYIANGVVVHNCRSLLIPITRFQDYKVDTENNFGEEISPFIEENIGTGFSKFHVEQSAKKDDAPPAEEQPKKE